MTARIAAAVIALCAALLTADAIVARVRTPKDDRHIKALQQEVKADAAAALKLDAVFKRVTAYRRARKLRDGIAAWILIAASAVFLLTVKRPPRRFPAPAVEGAAGRVRAKRELRPAADAPLDLAFVDDIVARLGRTRESAIPLLQAIQAHYRYLPDDALRRLCEITGITPAQIAGTSSFYGQFRRSPVGKHIVKVCHGTACHVAGARQITEEIRRSLAIPEGADTDPSRTFTIEEVACLGCCSLAPVLMVDERTAGKLTPASASDALEKESA
ncbi:MAG: NAD(P)H-dependent oxidoreductase subunit E [Bryobacteraceae bacterium]